MEFANTHGQTMEDEHQDIAEYNALSFDNTQRDDAQSTGQLLTDLLWVDTEDIYQSWDDIHGVDPGYSGQAWTAPLSPATQDNFTANEAANAGISGFFNHQWGDFSQSTVVMPSNQGQQFPQQPSLLAQDSIYQLPVVSTQSLYHNHNSPYHHPSPPAIFPGNIAPAYTALSTPQTDIPFLPPPQPLTAQTPLAVAAPPSNPTPLQPTNMARQAASRRTSSRRASRRATSTRAAASTTATASTTTTVMRTPLHDRGRDSVAPKKIYCLLCANHKGITSWSGLRRHFKTCTTTKHEMPDTMAGRGIEDEEEHAHLYVVKSAKWVWNEDGE